MCETINNHCVYRHTSPEGKVYIGTTSQNPEKRWRGGLGYADNLHFLADILDFGWRNFEHDILETDLTAHQAHCLEAKLIAQYDSTNPERGYNKSPGIMPRDWAAPEPTLPPEPLPFSAPAPRPLRCVETADQYPSIKAAAAAIGVDKSNIKRAIQHGYKCHGYHWEFVDD